MTGISLKPSKDGTIFDLDLSSGQIELREVTHQNQAMLLAARPGEYKEFPAVGVGIPDMLMDENLSGWNKRIIEQLEADGQRITRLKITSSGVELEAKYK